MKKFIIQNAIVNINNEKINILILENKEKLEKYILYLVNNTNKEINSTNKFEKFEFKDAINITPKKKLIDSKIEVFYNSSTKKHSLLLNKKQIYFTLNPHITLYNENIIINDNFKLIKADSTLYNPSGIIHSFVAPTTFGESDGSAENNLISKILNDNKNKIEENIELKNLINNTVEHSNVNEVTNEVTCNLQQPHVNLTNTYSGLVNIVEERSNESIQVPDEAVGIIRSVVDPTSFDNSSGSESAEFSKEIVKSEELLENTIEKEVSMENIIEIGIIHSYVAPTTFDKSSGSESGQALLSSAENEEEVSMENIIEIENEVEKEEVSVENTVENTVEIKKEKVSVEDSGIIRSFVAPDSGGSASEQALLGPAEIKIINLNSKIIPNNSEILLPDCKEIKIIEKNFEEDKEIKNIEILKMDNVENKLNMDNLENKLKMDNVENKLKMDNVENKLNMDNVENKLNMDNVENKLKNIFDLDKIMIDFNNLFNDLSNEETELEVEMKSELSKNKNISSKKVHFSEQNTMGNIRSFVDPINFDKSRESTSEQSILGPTKVNKDIMNINIPHANNTLNEIKKNNDLLYNKVVNYQNVNYKIPTIRILPTQNLNFSNLYTSQIHENNILLNLNLSIELGKDNLSYLIKIANQKYLINKTNNSIVLTNLFNKNSQIIKNKDNFKIGMLDYILYNDCTLLMQVTNQKYFDNSNGRTISFYTPKI
jgi:hypothetical protein